MVYEEYKRIQKETQNSLMKNVSDFSFPRLVGTKGEFKAQELLKKKINDLGYKTKVEKLNASFFRTNYLQNLGNLFGGILFLISAFLFSLHPFLFIIPITLIFIEIKLMSSGTPKSGQPPNIPKWIKVLPTENIFVEMNSNEFKKTVIFMGHYDSKSTRFTGAQRIILFLLFFISALLMVVLGIIGIIFSVIISLKVYLSNIEIGIWIISILGFIAGFILVLNTVGNKSPGACDNATAIAIVLECMKYFKNKELNSNLIFLFPAAEEIGLTGSYNFIKNRLKTLDKKKTFIINWDLAGLEGDIKIVNAIGIPKQACSKTMSKLIPKIAEEQNLDIKLQYLPIGGWTDSLSFNAYGYESFTIANIGGTVAVHSKNDIPDIISEESIFNAWVVGTELAKKLIKS